MDPIYVALKIQRKTKRIVAIVDVVI
jgi:hypothetical protein